MRQVLYFCTRQAKFRGDSIDRLASQEQVDDIGELRAPSGQARPAEGVVWIHRHLSDRVLGKTDQPRVPVAGEVDPTQVLVHDLGEDPLIIADHDELARGVTLESVADVPGVIVENFGAIGMKPSARQSVLKAEFRRQRVNGGADPLRRHARLAERR
jgi:hypothetical protein